MSELATSFDYRSLDGESRIVVEQKTAEIRDRIGRAALNIFEIGERLVAVKARLGHGQFGTWLDAEFGWSDWTARKMMAVASQFKSVNFSDLKIAPSALYLLASEGVPAEVREEVIEQAKAGKQVTHADVKRAVSRSQVMECRFCGENRPNDPGACPFCKDTVQPDPTDPVVEFTEDGEPVIDAPEIVVVETKPDPASLIVPGGCSTDDLNSLVAAGRKFACVYADPPWQYGNQATRAATDNHYPTMPLEEICGLPVKHLAADCAHLHLWTTNAFLFDAKRVMEAWGFEYKSCRVWVKPQMGIGNYWRLAHEFLLFGLRVPEKGRFPFLHRGMMSWLKLDRTKHSAKPDEFRADIEKVSPGPRLELFGRALSPGWTVWGNQISRTVFDVAEAI